MREVGLRRLAFGSPGPDRIALLSIWFWMTIVVVLTARAMRQVLIDHARSRVCLKRGGEIVFTEASENHVDGSGDMADMLALDQSLTELAGIDPRAGLVVELHVFGGLTIEEIADIQGLTVRTAYRDWRRARAFLVQRLGLTPIAPES